MYAAYCTQDNCNSSGRAEAPQARKHRWVFELPTCLKCLIVSKAFKQVGEFESRYAGSMDFHVL